MTKLVESIAKSLVEHPDSVVVTETKDDQGSVLQLQVQLSQLLSAVHILYCKAYQVSYIKGILRQL